MTEEERETYMDKLDAEGRQGQAAFLRIIQLCEDYQNADIEGHDDDRVRADADRRIAQILGVASKAIRNDDYHPNLDGPAEPVGLCMTANGTVAHFLELIEGNDWKCRRCGKVIEILPPND